MNIDVEFDSIPQEVIAAALLVQRFFEERNDSNWQFMGLEIRGYDPEYIEYTPAMLAYDRQRRAHEWRELRRTDPNAARRKWRFERISRRTARWAESKLLEHASPMLALQMFSNTKIGG